MGVRPCVVALILSTHAMVLSLLLGLEKSNGFAPIWAIILLVLLFLVHLISEKSTEPSAHSDDPTVRSFPHGRLRHFGLSGGSDFLFALSVSKGSVFPKIKAPPEVLLLCRISGGIFEDSL